MTFLSGTPVRTLVAAAVIAVAGPVALASPASAVSQAAAESSFRAAGITWTSSGGCTNPANSTCTSFEGLRQATVDGAVTLKGASGCALTITGGTETGHAGGTYSHANGYKLDFSRTTCLTSWIHGTYTYIGQRGDGARAVRGRLRQRVRRRGQPLGRHLLQLRLLTGLACAVGREGALRGAVEGALRGAVG